MRFAFIIILIFFWWSWSYAIDTHKNDTTAVSMRVAVGQFKLEPDLEKNLKKIQEYLNDAAAKNVDLIVFPELALTGYPPKNIKKLDYVNQKKTEEALFIIKNRAKELSIAIALGLVWLDHESVWRNRALFINEEGKILASYDKIQQTGHERKFFVDGEHLPTFTWRGLKLGMLICMDMRFPELWRLMRMQDVNLMLHLAAAYGDNEWKLPVLEGTMRCRAAENGYFIVSCNNAGPIPMMTSAIYNPKGLIMARANFANEELVVSDIVVGAPEGFVDFKDNIYKLNRIVND